MSDNVEAAVHVPQKRNFGPAWHKDGASFGKPPVTAVQPHDVAPLRGIFGSGPTRAESSQSWDARPRVTEKVRYKYTAAELLAARRPAVVLESLRLALPAEIVSNDPLEPSCTQQRPSHSQIQEKWDALRRTEPRKPPGVAHQRASFEAPPPRATLAAGSTTALPEQSGPSRWERGMSLPQAGTEKLWDEPDDETFGDHGDATALSSWSEAAARFAREMKTLRDNPDSALAQSLAIGTPDMFGAAFSSGGGDDEALEPALASSRARSNGKLEALEAASAFAATSRLSGPPSQSSLDWRLEPWFYRDPQGLFQGPFQAEQMRQWFELGYFDDGLPLRLGEAGDFTPLGELFRDAADAFTTPPHFPQEPSPQPAFFVETALEEPIPPEAPSSFAWMWGAAPEAALEVPQDDRLLGGSWPTSQTGWPSTEPNFPRQQQPSQMQQQLQQQQQAQQQQAQQHAAAQQQQQQAAPAADGGLDSTLALKLMLGMGGMGLGAGLAEERPQPTRQAQPAARQQPPARPPPQQQQPPPARPPQQQPPQQQPQPPQPQYAPRPSEGPVWGEPSAPAAVHRDDKRLSMREIQQQEESAARRVQQQRVEAAHAAGHRAPVQQQESMASRLAAAHSAPAQRAPVRNVQPTMQQQQAHAAQIAQQQQQQQAAQASAYAAAQAQAYAAAQAQAQAQAQAAQRRQPAARPVAEFGNVSEPLEAWCKVQLKKIGHSDHITLIHFCMTLEDNSEIRQYLSMYLGSTPQVAAFANDFIKKKSGKESKPPPQPNDEMTEVTSKRRRGRKAAK